MLDALRRLVRDSVQGSVPAHTPVHTHDVRVAACALLLELANSDGEFSDAERERIRDILQRHFGVDGDGADALMAEAASAARDAVDDFVFTRQVVREYDLAQRMVLAELMWQVVLTDGVLAERESYLMRKLANLLQLEPAFLSEARKKTENGQREP
jgi:uncharacterized tellurite resistance protein B-like protein